ncbi:MAG: putative porin [Bacteroidota bacterium]
MRPLVHLYLFVFFFGIFGPGTLWAQAPPRGTTTGDSGFLEQIFVEPDTFDVSYFYVPNPKVLISYDDTLLSNHFHQPQPSRGQGIERINLGNVGTPQQQLVFEPVFRRGYDIGLHQFDGYYLPSDSIPFYVIDKAFTDAAFAQGRTQQDQILSVDFSRNFGPQVNMSIDFLRINHAGVYKNQAAKNTALGTGFWYHHPSGTYDGYFTFTHNSSFQGHNGGIDTSSVTTTNRSEEGTVPVLLEGTKMAFRGVGADAAAETRYQKQEVAYAHYFRLVGPRENQPRRRKRKKGASPPPPSTEVPPPDTLTGVDSLEVTALTDGTTEVLDTMVRTDSSAQIPPPQKVRRPWKREFLVFHKISYANNWYKFSDISLAADSAYYGRYQVHNQGLRHYIRERVLENTFRIGTARQDGGGRTASKNRGKLEVGLIHRLIRLEQEPVPTQTLNNLLLTGNWKFAPTPQIQLLTYAHYSLLQNIGDYHLSGDLQIDLGQLGVFEARAQQQLYAPSHIQNRFYVTESLVWERDFRKTFETTLAATYRLPQFGTEVGGQYHLINNYIYFDTIAQPQQSATVINVPQIYIRQNFSLGVLHLDNTFVWQFSSQQDLLPLPTLYGKHQLYIRGRIFRKVMLARLGIDVQWNSNYLPNAYQHLFGQFHLQETERYGFQPIIDLSLSIKVKTVRAFVKTENLNQFLRPNDFIFQTPLHARPYFLIRFGLSWRFLN